MSLLCVSRGRSIIKFTDLFHVLSIRVEASLTSFLVVNLDSISIMPQAGWDEWNYCIISLFLLINCLRSCFIPSILFSMVFPRCFPLVPQWRLLTQSLRFGKSLYLLRKAVTLCFALIRPWIIICTELQTKCI